MREYLQYLAVKQSVNPKAYFSVEKYWWGKLWMQSFESGLAQKNNEALRDFNHHGATGTRTCAGRLDQGAIWDGSNQACWTFYPELPNCPIVLPRGLNEEEANVEAEQQLGTWWPARKTSVTVCADRSRVSSGWWGLAEQSELDKLKRPSKTNSLSRFTTTERECTQTLHHHTGRDASGIVTFSH